MCPNIVAHRRFSQPKSLVLVEMVGDPGIEPGMGLPGGVTVRCRTLQHVARRTPSAWGVIILMAPGRQADFGGLRPGAPARREKGDRRKIR